MTDESQPEQRRTWLPLGIAGAVAALVVVGAVVATALAGRLDPVESAAVEACEAALAAAQPDGQAPGIVAGDVYLPGDADELAAFLVEQGLVAPETSEPETPDAVTVVWWLDTEEHWWCTVDATEDGVVGETASAGPVPVAE